MKIELNVNGEDVVLDVEPRRLLADVLRQDLRLYGTHLGCEHGVCGACTIHLDGEPVRSCLMFAVMAQGHRITTVEGLGTVADPHPVQRAFAQEHGLQCGFCTPGMMMTARWLLDREPDPDEATIREAISGQLCRCTGYENIVRAVRWAAQHPAAASTQEEVQA